MGPRNRPSLYDNLELIGGLKQQPQNWGCLAASILGPRIPLFLSPSPCFPDCCTLFLLTSGKHSARKDQSLNLHRQLSCERDQRERNGHSGGPSWRSQSFCGPGNGVACRPHNLGFVLAAQLTCQLSCKVFVGFSVDRSHIHGLNISSRASRVRRVVS